MYIYIYACITLDTAVPRVLTTAGASENHMYRKIMSARSRLVVTAMFRACCLEG